MEVVLSLRVRSGRPPSGFTLTILIKSSQMVVLIAIRIVKDGLHLVSALGTQNIWWELLTYQVTAGEAAISARAVRL